MSEKITGEIFDIALSEDVVSKSDVIDLSLRCSISEVNILILRLNQLSSDWRKSAYRLSDIALLLSDDVRRRAELLEL